MITIANQYALTVEEAAVYFNIGEGKLRKIISDNSRAGYLLRNGNRVLFKRKKFENFLDDIDEI